MPWSLMQVKPEQEELLQSLLKVQHESEHRSLYHLPHMKLWTKLRPGVHVSKTLQVLSFKTCPRIITKPDHTCYPQITSPYAATEMAIHCKILATAASISAMACMQ